MRAMIGAMALLVAPLAAPLAAQARSQSQAQSQSQPQVGARAVPAPAATLAIVHARAFTMAEGGAGGDGTRPIDDATILVAGGKVAAVIAHGAAPAGAKVIDAHGRIVTPGLFSPATQLGLVEVAAAADTDDRSATSGPLGAAFDASFALNDQAVAVPIARADGVTRAMSYPEAAAVQPFRGQGALIRLRPGGELLDRPRAAMFVAIGDGSQARAGGSRAAQWGLLRNALAEARAFGAAPRGLARRDQLLARPDAEALQPVVKGLVPLVIAADRLSDIREAIRLAADAHVRVVLLGGVEAWRAAAALAAAHIPVILDPEVDLPQSFDWLGARLDNAALLRKAGVTIAFSVSGNTIYLSNVVGLAMREGAGIAVANGLAYGEGLRAITAAPADIWGVAGAGRIAPGADADIVIWDGDPLEPTSAPLTVLVGGRPASLATRQTLLRDRYAPQRAGDPLPPAYR